MNKLYPPHIDSTLPAMTTESDGSIKLTVPFRMNSAVALGDISQMAVLIKTVSTGVLKQEDVLSNEKNDEYNKYDLSTGMQQVTFSLDGRKYRKGQYYKVQIAFVHIDGTIGYYSTVGIVKYINRPQISIQGLDVNSTKNNQNTYIGVYESPYDASEKVYSYCFTISRNNQVYETSGVQIHNTANDAKSTQSIDMWTPTRMLSLNTPYTITYSVTTINKLTLTISYPIILAFEEKDFMQDGIFAATRYYDNAYVKLHCQHSRANEQFILEKGEYVITKASSKDNFTSWTKFLSVHMVNDVLNPVFCNDFAIEQGISYQYRLQQVVDGKLTRPARALCYLSESDELNRKGGTKLTADFEDMFLFDGQRQLCIQYNPKVSSFKPVILESKIDTLGGAYPFIFRNNNVNYKEFAISGLISAHMDVNGLFRNKIYEQESFRTSTPGFDITTQRGLITEDAKVLRDNRQVYITPKVQNVVEPMLTTALDGNNFKAEREFKNEVLSWLTNGEPKLFRSPGEGNFIVRILNVSLSPNDTLGRMLHTFTCTAYEVAEYNQENLEKYGFLQPSINYIA